jgi:hypothetical protein
MCLLAVSLAGCFESNALSIYGNPESEGMAGLRLGTEAVQNLEVGAALQFSPSESTTAVTRNRKRHGKTIVHEHENDWQYGIYSLYHFPIGDISPYAGVQANIGNGSADITKSVEPVAGIQAGPVFAEYQKVSLNGEDEKIIFGVKFRF